MPKRKYVKNVFIERKSKKRKKSRKRIYSRFPTAPGIASLRGPLGKTHRQTLKYSDSFTTGAAAAGLGTDMSICNTFRVNSLYDPDVTGIGHQPLGFDQLMEFFNRFTVLNCKITLSVSQAASATVASWFGVEVTPTSATRGSSLPDKQAWLESAATSKTLVGLQSSGAPVKTLTRTINMKKFLGVGNVLDEQNFSGSASSNPADTVYLQVYTACNCYALTGTGTTELHWTVQIEYDTVFHDPKPITIS